MSLWREVLTAIQDEALRWAQDLDERKVLPNAFIVRLPQEGAEPLAPVLAPAVAEVGEALVAWAEREGHSWYRDLGPFLTVELAEISAREIGAEFVRQAPEALPDAMRE